MRRVKLLSTVLLAVFVMSACNTGNNESKKPDAMQAEKEKTFKEIAKYPIPTSYDIIGLLSKAGAGYIIGINNPVANMEKYFTDTKKALNLGVYGADLSYATTYHQKQETMNYLKNCKQLVEDLQITTGFNAEMAESIEKNIDDKQKTIEIITDAFFESYEYLVNNGKDNLSVFVMSGSWLEAMYLTSQVALISNNNEDMKNIIKSQVTPLEKLIEIMEQHKENEAIANLKVKFVDLKAEIELIGEDFTDEKLITVSNKIDVLRNEIID